MVRRFDPGHHRSGIYSINPAPGNSLDPIHSFNCLYRHPIRFKVIKIIQTQGKEKTMLNACILTGNLGADPEIFYSSEDAPDLSAGEPNSKEISTYLRNLQKE